MTAFIMGGIIRQNTDLFHRFSYPGMKILLSRYETHVRYAI